MAPPALGRRLNPITNTQDTGDQPSPQLWILAPLIIGIVIAVALVVFFILRLTRQRRQSRKRAAERKRNPDLARNLSFWKRQPKPTPTQLQEEEEIQRSIIIRKSLVSRESRRLSQPVPDLPSDDDEDEEGQTRPKRASLKDEWKEWEAGLQRERSLSGEKHPAAHMLAEPAKAICIQLTPLPPGATSFTRARENQPLPPLPEKKPEPPIKSHPQAPPPVAKDSESTPQDPPLPEPAHVP